MATQRLRPTGAGFLTNWTANGAATNYQCVYEGTADNDTTYLDFTGIGANVTDLYTIYANSIGLTDTINSVTVYVVARMVTTGRLISSSVAPCIRENGTTTQASTQPLTSTSYATKSNTWTVKPSDGLAFTQSDITNLEIGVYGIQSNSQNCRCTQVYVVVDYTPSGGSVSKLALLGVG